MKQEAFVEATNDMEGLTIGQVISLIKKVKVSAVIGVVSFCVAVLGFVFGLGRYTQEKQTGILLDSPFSMRLVIDGKNNDLSNLTLLKDPTIPAPQGKVVLAIRQIKDEFDILQVGFISALEKLDKPSLFGLNLPLSDLGALKAYAVEGFSFGVHSGDSKYSEAFVPDHPDVIERTYSDGCVLRYTVDSEKEVRRSVRSSFHWVKYNH